MSSKYSEQVIEAACEAIDWAEGLVVTDALAVAVFDSLERAPWWEEVGVGYEFAQGEPWRTEKQEFVNENRAGTRFTVEEWSRYGWTYFRDTRWTPPPAPLAVGDVIENAEDVDHLPDGSVFIDCDEQAWQVDDGMAYVTGGGRGFVDGYFDYLPLTVVYVPKAGGSDD